MLVGIRSSRYSGCPAWKGNINMKEFDVLCKEFEETDALTYSAVLAGKAMKLIPALSLITEDGLSGIAVFSTFILGAIVADGKLAEEEYLLISPQLHAFFGTNIDYGDCKKLLRQLKPESRQLKKAVDEMVDVLGLLSDELKNDLITVCMMLCAIDGKISHKEKQWIKQLIR